MEYKDGAVYEGSWQNGKKHGIGRMNYENGDVYSGQWKNAMRHGKGQLDLANRDRYIGYFRNDMMQGKKGTYLVANGSKYEGGFVKNQRCGKGTFTTVDYRVSCGQWKDDKLHGKGYCEYSNGDRYYRYFKESQRNGEGEMLFASSALYAGQWREDGMLKGVFDFEQVSRNKKKNRWSSRKTNSQAILRTIQFKDSEVNEWAALSPKRVRRMNLFFWEAISFVSEDFVKKSEDFIKSFRNLGMTGLSESFVRVANLSIKPFGMITEHVATRTTAAVEIPPSPRTFEHATTINTGTILPEPIMAARRTAGVDTPFSPSNYATFEHTTNNTGTILPVLQVPIPDPVAVEPEQCYEILTTFRSMHLPSLGGLS